MKIHFLDTSVFCNILDVPFMADERDIAMDELDDIIKMVKMKKLFYLLRQS